MTGIIKKMHLGGIKEMMLTFPLYILTHPFKGFYDMKFQQRGDLRYGVIILVIAGFTAMIREAYTGFAVTGFWMDTPFVNVPQVLLFTYSPIVLFCVANWCVTTITDGKGSMREIFLTYAYAMYPMIILSLVGVIASNYVTVNEEAFATIPFVMGQVFLYAYLFLGLVVLHEYTFFRSIAMVVLTILAMLVITFVFALMFSLVSNVIFFFLQLVSEINLNLLN